MRKALTLAILGTALGLPFGARAQGAPTFVAAMACEAAAPLRTEALATRRAVSARVNGAVSAWVNGAVRARGDGLVGARVSATRGAPDPARATRAGQRASADRSARQAVRAQAPRDVPAMTGAEADAGDQVVEEAPALRRAVHFCVTSPGATRIWTT